MRYMNAGQLESVLDYPSLIDAISAAFKGTVHQATRAHYTIDQPGGRDATLLLMPAWTPGGYIGVKSATIFPDNAKRTSPSVMATYLLFDGSTGAPLVSMDGKTLTVLRTAATSALASKYLSRPESTSLLVVGAGSMCTALVEAHAFVRDLTRIQIWNRSPDHAAERVQELDAAGFTASISTDLEAACREADIISCATLSMEPLVKGEWLRAGTHVDLIGAYTPEMRETDSAVISRGHVFVDTFAGARSEAGDLLHAVEEGAFDFDEVESDLCALVSGQHVGRASQDEITIFKSVGAACEDLAAAILAYERLS